MASGDIRKAKAGTKLSVAADPKAETAARCHEIQVALNKIDVPEFDCVVEIGSAVRLALHIRGLPLVPYEVLRLVAVQMLSISSGAVRGITELLAEIEFLKIQSEGNTIHSALPTVPYYEDVYATIGGFAGSNRTF